MDRAAFDRAHPDSALYGIWLDEGCVAGDGQRGGRHDGGRLGAETDGTPFSISAAVGFISIFGVAVQDGVLLISYFNQMRGEGLPVRHGDHARGRAAGAPVVMTSLTAGWACSPPRGHLDRFAGPEPLAIVVVGGMLVTLFLTRYLMPVLYSFFPAPRSREPETEGDHMTTILNHQLVRQAGDGSTASRPSQVSAPMKLAVLAIILVLFSAALALLTSLVSAGDAQQWRASVSNSLSAPCGEPARARPACTPATWDGLSPVPERGCSAMGIATTEGRAPDRTDPAGAARHHRVRTDNLTKIRPLFKGRVDKVHTTVGQTRQQRSPADRPLQHRPRRGQELLRDQATSSGSTTRTC